MRNLPCMFVLVRGSFHDIWANALGVPITAAKTLWGKLAGVRLLGQQNAHRKKSRVQGL